MQLLKRGHDFNTRESTGGIAHCGILGPQKKRFWVQTQWRAGETPASQPPLPLMSLTLGALFTQHLVRLGLLFLCASKGKKKKKEKRKRKPPPAVDGTFPSMDENHLISYKLGLGVYYS